jgi:hypothetical protein
MIGDAKEEAVTYFKYLRTSDLRLGVEGGRKDVPQKP